MIKKFKDGKLSFKKYAPLSLENQSIDPSMFFGRTVGIYAYPKASKLYGCVLVIIENE